MSDSHDNNESMGTDRDDKKTKGFIPFETGKKPSDQMVVRSNTGGHTGFTLGNQYVDTNQMLNSLKDFLSSHGSSYSGINTGGSGRNSQDF